MKNNMENDGIRSEIIKKSEVVSIEDKLAIKDMIR